MPGRGLGCLSVKNPLLPFTVRVVNDGQLWKTDVSLLDVFIINLNSVGLILLNGITEVNFEYVTLTRDHIQNPLLLHFHIL
jgi:hypothetical protein